MTGFQPSLVFSHYQPPVIHFGIGKRKSLGSLIRIYGSKVLLITGAHRHGIVWDDIDKELEAFSIERESVSGEPSPEQIDRIVSRYHLQLPDVVVGIGGGSVMDAAKAISAMLPSAEPVLDYLEGIGTKKHEGKKIPLIAVPTTAGTGSEATKNAVLSRTGPDGFKKSLRHDRFVPDIALVDPEMTLSCPQALTASTGMDALTQLLESYFSTAANPLTDALAMSGLNAVSESLEAAYFNANDLAARTNMAYAALLSGITLANAGLGIVHGLAASIGGLFPAPHGIICGTLVAPCMEQTLRKLKSEQPHHPAINKMAMVGKLFASAQRNKNSDRAEYLIEALYDLSERLGLSQLQHYGITEKDLDRIITLTENKNNPVKLYPEEIRSVLLRRL